MVDIKKIQGLVEKIEECLVELKNIEASLSEEPLAAPVTVEPTVTAQAAKAVAQSSDDLGDFEGLKRALESNRWPEAVNPNLICDQQSESDKLGRGRGIVDLMIDTDLNSKKVLDIGCGEGHFSFVAAEYSPELSVGYDIKTDPHWSTFEKPNLLLTTDLTEVESRGPYDVIVLFDVIDHIQQAQPVDLLKKAKDMLTPDGKIYMRCHPFVSRHGTHLYHACNKAFAHLVFTPAELSQLVPDRSMEVPSIGVVFPIKTYQDFIDKAGLKVDNRRDVSVKVEPFFKIPKIAERIMKNTGVPSFPEFQMSLEFIDFVLKK